MIYVSQSKVIVQARSFVPNEKIMRLDNNTFCLGVIWSQSMGSVNCKHIFIHGTLRWSTGRCWGKQEASLLFWSFIHWGTWSILGTLLINASSIPHICDNSEQKTTWHFCSVLPSGALKCGISISLLPGEKWAFLSVSLWEGPGNSWPWQFLFSWGLCLIPGKRAFTVHPCWKSSLGGPHGEDSGFEICCGMGLVV